MYILINNIKLQLHTYVDDELVGYLRIIVIELQDLIVRTLAASLLSYVCNSTLKVSVICEQKSGILFLQKSCSGV